jgi:hypothetical protein
LKKTPSGGRMMARMMSMQFAVPSSDIFFSLQGDETARREGMCR